VFSSIAFTLPKEKSIAFENILVSECLMSAYQKISQEDAGLEKVILPCA
jgi:hypothetical protein